MARTKTNTQGVLGSALGDGFLLGWILASWCIVRTNNTFELQNDVTLRLFPERSFSKFSGLYASLTVQYMNSKLQTPNYHMF